MKGLSSKSWFYRGLRLFFITFLRSKSRYLGYSLRIILVVALTGLLIFSFSESHLKRNRNNKLPIGKLSFTKEKVYKDEKGNIWELQPHSKNIFHQPENYADTVVIPYSILENPPKLNLDYPYLKLLCIQKDGSSWEAILTPNNSYITKGKELGTFNYATPNGIWGSLKHTFWDIIPHFVCSDYEKRQKTAAL